MINKAQPDINNLIKTYNELYFWQIWIFPKKINEAIASPNSTEYSLCEAFIDNTWFFQRWLIGALSAFSSSSIMLAYKASELLAGLSIFKSSSSSSSMISSDRESNFNALMQQEHIVPLIDAINILHKADRATDSNLCQLINTRDPVGVALSLTKVITAGITRIDNSFHDCCSNERICRMMIGENADYFNFQMGQVQDVLNVLMTQEKNKDAAAFKKTSASLEEFFDQIQSKENQSMLFTGVASKFNQ